MTTVSPDTSPRNALKRVLVAAFGVPGAALPDGARVPTATERAG